MEGCLETTTNITPSLALLQNVGLCSHTRVDHFTLLLIFLLLLKDIYIVLILLIFHILLADQSNP